MKLKDSTVPVVVLDCGIASLGIMRSLGRLSVPVYGVDEDASAPGLVSRYCRGAFVPKLDKERPEEYIDELLGIGKKLGSTCILIPTSDILANLVAEYSDRLRPGFRFQDNSLALIRDLVSKKYMYRLAVKHGVPTPFTQFPRSLEDVESMIDDIRYPVMLKAIHGERMYQRTGKKMVPVSSEDELIRTYKFLDDPKEPNIMIQELIPGGDDKVFMFNGYFNEKSDCLAGFTGRKIRQNPIHTGATSLGECCWNEEVANLITTFMKNIGYRGMLDIGCRLDPRDGLYKILDINPRIGQTFRLFVAKEELDVVRALYMDFTGQEIGTVTPKEGRRWLVEDDDLVSSIRYFQEGSLTAGDWLRSFRGVEEGAWFSWADPKPFMAMACRRIKRGFSKRARQTTKPASAPNLS